MRIRIGEAVSGTTLHTDEKVIGTFEGFNHREGTVQVHTATGTHLCRLKTVISLNPAGSPGAMRHMQMCPDHMRAYLQPEIVPC